MCNSSTEVQENFALLQGKWPIIFHNDGIDALCATSIHASLSTLLLSEKFSDFAIRCGGRDFKAHRAIVCTQSSFFDRALSSNFKEATARVVELPDDDPDVLERFLEFLYTGTYTDNVNNTWGKPSVVATMSPEEVQESLNSAPGIPECAPEGNRGLPTPLLGPRKSNQDGPAEDEDEDDSEYEPKSPDSELDEEYEEEEEEPEEEYNEFDAENPWDEEQEPGCEEQGNDKLAELGALSKEEALQKLASERNDMALPLRLYIMGDKYDVPALRLLARDRFYRAVELEWEHAECFPDIVDELYEHTPDTDVAMREIVCRIIGTNMLYEKVRERMRPVMTKHGDFAVGVMEYAILSGRIR